jgi:hypothetical protein
VYFDPLAYTGRVDICLRADVAHQSCGFEKKHHATFSTYTLSCEVVVTMWVIEAAARYFWARGSRRINQLDQLFQNTDGANRICTKSYITSGHEA